MIDKKFTQLKELLKKSIEKSAEIKQESNPYKKIKLLNELYDDYIKNEKYWNEFDDFKNKLKNQSKQLLEEVSTLTDTIRITRSVSNTFKIFEFQEKLQQIINLN